MSEVAQAVERAQADAKAQALGVADGRARSVGVAIGDPQAPLHRFFEVLAHHRLLGADGRLRPHVHLVSMGDHFDWGPAAQRAQATAEGTCLLWWLSAHPADQVTILLGNHDLARVEELADFSADAFAQAQAEAMAVWKGGQPLEAEEAAFTARWPQLPDSEALARDYACFEVSQRALVSVLLRECRAQIALERGGLLLVHAGVTRDDLALAGLPTHGDAAQTAQALNGWLQARVAAWSGAGPLELSPLHQRGTAAGGEGRGIFYQRPSNPMLEPAARFAGPPARRFDPRRMPLQLTQAIGHIRDDKCRALLGPWAVGEVAGDGPLRSLTVEGEEVRYQAGVQSGAHLLFLDGGMSHAKPQDYALLDLDRRAPYSAVVGA
jgi:hypothetical protein